MRLTDLLGADVVTTGGTHLGKIHDALLIQDGSGIRQPAPHFASMRSRSVGDPSAHGSGTRKGTSRDRGCCVGCSIGRLASSPGPRSCSATSTASSSIHPSMHRIRTDVPQPDRRQRITRCTCSPCPRRRRRLPRMGRRRPPASGASMPSWPHEGSEFHHAIGHRLAPELRDSTEVLERAPPHRLVLEVRFRPTGTARVELDGRRRPLDGTAVTMDRDAADSGPVSWLPWFLTDPALHVKETHCRCSGCATRSSSGPRAAPEPRGVLTASPS